MIPGVDLGTGSTLQVQQSGGEFIGSTGYTFANTILPALTICAIILVVAMFKRLFVEPFNIVKSFN